MSFTFGRGVRVRTRDEFAAVKQSGRRVTTRYLTLVACPNAGAADRLGIIASRRLGGAVTRNRAKRRIREIFRRQEPAGAAARGDRPLDVVVIPRREVIDAPIAVLEAEFRAALKRLRVAR